MRQKQRKQVQGIKDKLKQINKVAEMGGNGVTKKQISEEIEKQRNVETKRQTRKGNGEIQKRRKKKQINQATEKQRNEETKKQGNGDKNKQINKQIEEMEKQRNE